MGGVPLMYCKDKFCHSRPIEFVYSCFCLGLYGSVGSIGPYLTPWMPKCDDVIGKPTNFAIIGGGGTFLGGSIIISPGGKNMCLGHSGDRLFTGCLFLRLRGNGKV